MKRKRHTREEIIKKLREAATLLAGGQSVEEACKKLEVSPPTYHRWRRSGHLFQGRYKAHLVDADAYAQELVRYVHLDPVRPADKTAAVPEERLETLCNYRWSSHRVYAGLEAAPPWLAANWLA